MTCEVSLDVMMTIKLLLLALLGISSAGAAVSCFSEVGYLTTPSGSVTVGSNGDAMLFNAPFTCATSIVRVNYTFDVAPVAGNKQYWSIWRLDPLGPGDYDMVAMEAFSATIAGSHSDVINPAIQVQEDDIIGIHMESSANDAPLPYVDDISIAQCTGSCTYSSANLVHYAKWDTTGLTTSSTWDVSANGFSTGADKRFPAIEFV